MPVTEFAVFTLRDTYDPIELLEVVMECQEIQDDWVRANHPNNCAKRASVSRMYTDTTVCPDRVAITAPWQSAAAHHEWIDTAANRGVMARFAAFLPGGAVPDHHCDEVSAAAAPANPGFLFFHMDAAGRRPVLHLAFSPKEALVVTRLAAQGGREKLQASYVELEEALLAEDPNDRVWAGWRIEKEKDHEELVVFRNADVDVERLAPLKQHGKPIDRELQLREIAP